MYKDPNRQREAVKAAGLRRQERKRAERLLEKGGSTISSIGAARLAKDADNLHVTHFKKYRHAHPGGVEVGPPDLIHWIERTLTVPTGPLMGKHFRVPDYQADFVQAGLEPGIFEAAQSIARKNGKTGIIAAVLLAGLAQNGPLNRPQWRGVVTSLTGPLAGELKSAMELTAKASDLRGIEFLRSPTPGLARGLQGSLINFLAADKATGHAIGADLAIIDESGLSARSQARAWLMPSLSCVSGRNGKLWHISIKGDGPFLPELELRGASKRVHYVEYASDRSATLTDHTAWHAANPGLIPGIKSIEYMEAAAERATLSTRK